MRWRDRFLDAWYRLRTSARRDARHAELAEELAFHEEMIARDLEHGGMSAADAAGAAKRQLGNSLALRERSAESWGLPSLETVWQDVRYGARMLRNSPVFTLVGVGAIGLAIGVNAGFFTLVDRFLWQPMPVARPERLVKPLLVRANGWENIRFSYPDILTLASRSKTLTDVMGYNAMPVALRASPSQPGASIATSGAITANYFSALGGTAAIGRLFAPRDDDAGAPPTAVISEALWDREFGRAADIVGRDVIIDRAHVTVVGVVERHFVGLNPLVPDVWLTFRTADQIGALGGRLLDPTNRFIAVHARLSPGATTGQAEGEVSGLVAEPRGAAGSDADLTRLVGVRLQARKTIAPVTIETMLIAAPGMFLVALVLVIACANLASLLLARSLARQREIAVRLALGASRGRLIRQLLTESALLAALGGALGLVLARWTVTVASRSFLSAFTATLGTLALDFDMSWRVVAFTIGIACFSVIVFGLTPALQSTSPNLLPALKGEDAVAGSRLRRSKFRDGLVAAQVAACLILLVAAGTLVQSLREVAHVDTGVDARHVSVVRFGLSGDDHVAALDAAARAAYAARAENVAGVKGVARALAPLAAVGLVWPSVHAGTSDSAGARHWLPSNKVTPKYFDVIGQRIVRGRAFTPSDSGANAPIAIVSVVTARLLWPGADAVGQTLRVAGQRDAPPTAYTVIGIVSDARVGGLWGSGDIGQIYFPVTATDLATRELPMLVRTVDDGADIAPALTRLGQEIDPSLPVRVTRLADMFEIQLVPFRYAAGVGLGVGALGLALAVIGLYGVVAFAVEQRRRDIAVHVAMGAGPRDVLGLVLRRELRSAVVGLGVGLIAAGGVAKVLSSMAIPLASLGVAGLLVLAALLLVVTVIAAAVPASAALRIAPMQVLRQE